MQIHVFLVFDNIMLSEMLSPVFFFLYKNGCFEETVNKC